LQRAFDTRHSLIVHHAVCCETSDQRQLWSIAHAVREPLDRRELSVVADAGYSSVAQLKACEADGVAAYVLLSCTYTLVTPNSARSRPSRTSQQATITFVRKASGWSASNWCANCAW
jgi:hypothetical protein